MYEVAATFQAVSHTDLVHLHSPSSQSYRLWQTLGAGHLLSSFPAVPGAACVAVPMDVKYRRKPIASSSYYIPGLKHAMNILQWWQLHTIQLPL